jgi:hypothetical protein
MGGDRAGVSSVLQRPPSTACPGTLPAICFITYAAAWLAEGGAAKHAAMVFSAEEQDQLMRVLRRSGLDASQRAPGVTSYSAC